MTNDVVGELARRSLDQCVYELRFCGSCWVVRSGRLSAVRVLGLLLFV